METMKIDRLKIVPNYRNEGLSIIDIDGTYKRSFTSLFNFFYKIFYQDEILREV